MIKGFVLSAFCLALAAQDRPVLVNHVRVFDGTQVLGADSVRFEKGRITELGRNLPPKGATVVDGAGRTLLPGLVDAHVHAYGEALAQSLAFGVTTVIDCFTDPTFVRQAKTRASQREADILSAGHLATVPGGHGTEYPIHVPTLRTAAEAGPWVKARVAEGSDFIKVVREDGHGYKLDFPTLDWPVVAALVQEAHAVHRLAVAHVASQADAEGCLERGVDGLAHVWGDALPSSRTLTLLKAPGRFVTPTLAVFQAGTGKPQGAALAEDPALNPFLSGDAMRGLKATSTWQAAAGARYPVAVQATAALHRAGVRLLAGTDAPNPGTTWGASLHGELALLVEAGLKPAEALTAATAGPAEAFRLKDRGRIEVGARADLLLVEGDPTRDIQATRAIVQVWKAGEALDRGALAAEVKQARVEQAQALQAQEPVRWTFASGADLAAWGPTTDAPAGGASKASVARHPAGGLHLTGQVDGRLPFAWAGAAWLPAGDFKKGRDFRALKTLRFRATGQGSFRVQLFTLTGGFMPKERRFTAEPGGTEVVMPLAAFQADLSKVNALAICGGPGAGPLELRLEDLRLE